MKYKIAISNGVDPRHRLLAVGRDTTPGNKLKAQPGEFSRRATIHILGTGCFELQNPKKPYHKRDNIFLLKAGYEYTNDKTPIYYITDSHLQNKSYI